MLTSAHPALDRRPPHEPPMDLYLNGRVVGTVQPYSRDGSWIFGTFKPAPGFSEFAAIFGRWSLLMHVDGEGERLSPEAAEELRQVEYAIHAMHPMLRAQGSVQWHRIAELTIDGDLAEWREL